MKYKKHIHYVSWLKFLFFSALGPMIATGANLPNVVIPLGPPDLVETRTTKELRPGLTHVYIARHLNTKRSDVYANGIINSTQKVISVHVIKLDPKVYKGKIISSWSEAGWLTSPYELALRDNAVVAANASFYEFSNDDIPGITSGLSIVQGIWHHEHDGWAMDGGHPFLAIENTDEGPKLSIEYELPPRPHLKWGSKSIRIDGIDRAPKRDQSEIVVMRRSLVSKSQLSHGTAEKLYTTTIINETFSGFPFYIIASGEKEKILQEMIDSGTPLELDLSVPGRPGLNVFFAQYPLIINGETPEVDPNAAATRTAVGSDPDGNIYLISVGPKGPGVTLRELQGFGKFLGLTNFYNLDGGWGSTSLVIEKKNIGLGPEVPFYNERSRVADSILIVDSE